jgi:hypothetical protein
MVECWNIGKVGFGLRLGESNGMMGLKKKGIKTHNSVVIL